MVCRARVVKLRLYPARQLPDHKEKNESVSQKEKLFVDHPCFGFLLPTRFRFFGKHLSMPDVLKLTHLKPAA
jgi:hypothetical protein